MSRLFLLGILTSKLRFNQTDSLKVWFPPDKIYILPLLKEKFGGSICYNKRVGHNRIKKYGCWVLKSKSKILKLLSTINSHRDRLPFEFVASSKAFAVRLKDH